MERIYFPSHTYIAATMYLKEKANFVINHSSIRAIIKLQNILMRSIYFAIQSSPTAPPISLLKKNVTQYPSNPKRLIPFNTPHVTTKHRHHRLPTS